MAGRLCRYKTQPYSSPVAQLRRAPIELRPLLLAEWSKGLSNRRRRAGNNNKHHADQASSKYLVSVEADALRGQTDMDHRPYAKSAERNMK